MKFIEETGFTVRTGREEAFQRWLAASEARIARSYPQGTMYLGTYIATFTTEKASGQYRLLEAFESYGDIDRLAALQADPASEYAKVWREGVGFMEPDLHADWSRTLLKSVVAATIWDVQPELVAETPAVPAG